MIQYDFHDLYTRSNATVFEETDFYKVISELPLCSPNGPWLGGGSLRKTLLGKEVDTDYDFFFKDEEQKKTFEETLISKGYTQSKKTNHHTEYLKGIVKVQLIHFKYYSNIEEMLDSFDYTICQLAYDGQKLYAGDHTLWDIGRKKISNQ